MAKSKIPPHTESLVYKSWLAHGAIRIIQATKGRDALWDTPDARFAFFPADQYGPVDTILGTDTHLYVKLEIQHRRRGSNDIEISEHWECVPIQIKGGPKCDFAITPFPNPLPETIKARLGVRSRRKVFAHYQRHRTVNCVLLVPKCSEDDPDFSKVLDEVWKSTLELVNMKFKIIGLKHRVK